MSACLQIYSFNCKLAIDFAVTDYLQVCLHMLSWISLQVMTFCWKL